MNNKVHCYGLKFIMRIEHRENFCRVKAIGKKKEKLSWNGLNKKHTLTIMRSQLWK